MGAAVKARGTIHWLTTGAICLNASVSAVFAVLLVVSTKAGDVGALYAMMRAVPLAAAALAHLFFYSPASLCAMALLLGCIQLGDFAIGIYLRDASRTGGPLVLALVTLVCAIPVVAELAIAPNKNPGDGTLR